MDNRQELIYLFGEFKFASGKLILWWRDELISEITVQPLKILSVLLGKGGDIATYDEIINAA